MMLAGKSRNSQLRNLLACASSTIGRTPTLRRIRSWTPRQRALAERWATGAYLRSIGFDQIHPPAPPPRFLRR
jgi:hypothetical protein